MLNPAELVLIGMVVAPSIVAVAAFTIGRAAPGVLGRTGAAIAALGFAGAVAVAIRAVGAGPVTAAAGPAQLTADRLSAALLLLVFGVSAIVQAFAVRYLAGDPRAYWFVGGAGLLTAASAGLATAGTLIGLAVCWSAAGAALCLLLGMYWDLPSARDGVRRTVTAFAIGDLALWTAVALATTTWGRIELTGSAIGDWTGPLATVAACLVVTAALSRSAQVPFHRWLPATLAAPTPVSALLHAGVVNAGGILLIRLAPLSAGGVAATLTVLLTVLAGVATIAYGTVTMLTKPDIKGALALSTTAQMGFMILTCGLGLWAATVIHLVAHGFYKATLFLSSGSAIARQRRALSLPPSQPRSRPTLVTGVAAAVLLPAVALAVALGVIPLPRGDHAAEQVLLVFAWATGAAAVWGWLARRPGLTGVLGAAALLLPAAIGYVAIITAAAHFLAPALPPTTTPGHLVGIVLAAAITVLGCLAAVRWSPAAGSLQRALYTRALSGAHLSAGPSRHGYPPVMTGARP